ncbi:MAG: TylF/MycF/NovP-related O-methyltransferase [Candidatus Binatia bacterium]
MRPRIKRLCKALLLRLGYEIHPVCKTQPNIDFTAALTVKESEYYTQWVAPCPLFSPWVGHPDFKAIYDGVAPYTIVSPDRCYMLVSLARYAVHLKGDFAECGVYKGGTALLLARVLKGRKKMLYLFDSFRGLPKVNREKDPWFQEGWFSQDSVASVKQVLSDFLNITDIREGWIPGTFAGLENRFYAFVHLDVDLYRSTLDCCEYFYPRLVSGGVLLFDEYGFAAARGEKDAVDEFFAGKPESPIVLPTGQAIILKVSPSDAATDFFSL